MASEKAGGKTSKKAPSPAPEEKPAADAADESTAIDVNLKELMRKQEELDRASAGDDEEDTPTNADA